MLCRKQGHNKSLKLSSDNKAMKNILGVCYAFKWLKMIMQIAITSNKYKC